jgi:putative ABC transport system permease protein
MHGAVLFVRAAGPPMRLADDVRAAVRRVDPDVALFGVEPLTATHGEALARERFTAVLLGVFALAALLLAVAGVHGMIAYSVAQRTRELGIRAALGATPRELRGLFVREGALAGAGSVAGLAPALAGSALLAGLLHGVRPYDPATYAAAAGVIVVAAAVACWLPARRAAVVQPLDTLRGE